jgi:hypothetical protein
MKNTVEVIRDINAACNDDAEIETNQWNWSLILDYSLKVQLDLIKDCANGHYTWWLNRNVKPMIYKGKTLGLIISSYFIIFKE